MSVTEIMRWLAALSMLAVGIYFGYSANPAAAIGWVLSAAGWAEAWTDHSEQGEANG